ncbi:MAG TPA: hypothetical protein VK171_14275 [Fimbriimonas sp.]|nr:hypothetical protein [Fimbriimonas sp.]
MHHWNPFSKERRLERRDLIIGWLMFLGIVFAVPGGIIVYFLGVGGGLGSIRIDGAFNILKIVPPIGVVMYLSGLAYGIYSEKNEYTGSRRTLKQCRIIARYAITRDHRMVTDETEFEFLDRPRYFVKMLHPQEGSIEYQCVPPVFFNCGEGMMGDADVQGQWLGSFRPYIGMPQTHVGERF